MVMKKIMLIVPSLIKGGVERVVSTLSKELSKYYGVYVVIYHNPVEYEIEGKLINLETPTGSFLRKLKNIFYRVIKLKRLIKEISPDFIVSFMGNLHPILTLKPVIVSIHNNPDFFPLYRKILLKTVYKFSNVKKIIICSSGLEKNLINNYRLKNTKIIYNPIDLNLIDQKLLALKPFEFDYILAVGRLNRQRGHDILIKSFSKSSLKNKVKLVILGEGKERKNLEKSINDLKIKNKVLLPGNVENPFVYMKYAQLFVHSSRCEGLSMVLLEALACNAPVIATNCCEISPYEVMENEVNSLIVPSGNDELLKDAMERLYHDRELYMKLKSNARKSIERFDIENIIKDWISLFEKEYCL
jgi:N-acetylgalactosamine-N,N'-diacetylbacillosaminyl-diphospho-undecaprenol 4-alpha-N-acetylgalactosaminyltransferase